MSFKIVTDQHRLRARSSESFVIPVSLPQEMMKLMREHKGVGLAAPQVGFFIRLFVTEWNEMFVNPVITAHSNDSEIKMEGCLSLPGVEVPVPRWTRITLNGNRDFKGIQARVIQHEIDHLNGILITDYRNGVHGISSGLSRVG